jgi:hypothetical protein
LDCRASQSSQRSTSECKRVGYVCEGKMKEGKRDVCVIEIAFLVCETLRCLKSLSAIWWRRLLRVQWVKSRHVVETRPVARSGIAQLCGEVVRRVKHMKSSFTSGDAQGTLTYDTHLIDTHTQLTVISSPSDLGSCLLSMHPSQALRKFLLSSSTCLSLRLLLHACLSLLF